MMGAREATLARVWAGAPGKGGGGWRGVFGLSCVRCAVPVACLPPVRAAERAWKKLKHRFLRRYSKSVKATSPNLTLNGKSEVAFLSESA